MVFGPFLVVIKASEQSQSYKQPQIPNFNKEKSPPHPPLAMVETWS
jgi:hypothetical protein